MKVKIEIRNRWTGRLIFEHSSENNTMVGTVTKAVSNHADMSGADLCGADLRGLNMIWADLRGAYLRGADLRGANLRNSYLSGADLRGADLRGAKLCGSDMRGVFLCGANLRDADLSCVNLIGAHFSEVDFIGANLRDAKGAYMSCPSKGEFIGWKKASGYIIKLRIPEDARRSSATGDKCRCDKAFVVEIQNLDGSKADVDTVSSSYDSNFVYSVGAIVEVSNFCDNRWNECAPGIHFFIDRRAAVEY